MRNEAARVTQKGSSGCEMPNCTFAHIVLCLREIPPQDRFAQIFENLRYQLDWRTSLLATT